MKTILLSKFAVALAGVAIIGTWARPDVANAQSQTTPECPVNSVCVWSERSFSGTLSVIPQSFLQTGGFSVGGISIGGTTQRCVLPGDIVGIGRSIRNNTSCRVYIYIDRNVDYLSGTRDSSHNLPIDSLPANTQKADSGEFRSVLAE